MPSTIITLPRSYKKYLSYHYERVTLSGGKFVITRSFLPLPGIEIRKANKYIKGSIYQTTLPTHCQPEQCKITLLSALKSLKSISNISITYKNNRINKYMAEVEGMAEAIGRSLRDYLLFDSEKYFYRLCFLSAIAWMLLLFLVSIVLLSSVALASATVTYIMLLAPVAAMCLGLMTGIISNYVWSARQLKIVYKKLIATIEMVSKWELDIIGIVNKRELYIIKELPEESSSSSQSLEMSNNTHQINLKSILQAKHCLFDTVSQFKRPEHNTMERESAIAFKEKKINHVEEQLRVAEKQYEGNNNKSFLLSSRH